LQAWNEQGNQPCWCFSGFYPVAIRISGKDLTEKVKLNTEQGGLLQYLVRFVIQNAVVVVKEKGVRHVDD